MSPRPRPAALAVCLVLSLPAPAQLVFDNVAPAAGVEWYGFGRGAGWSDFDHDGLLDLLLLYDSQPNVVFRQRQDHTFEDASAAWGLAPLQKHHWSCVVCDLDDDGGDDVFVGCGGFFAAETNLLYRSDFGTLGKFTNVSAAAGDATAIESPVFGSTALDHDVDGDLDLFFADIERFGLEGRCHLVRNDGDLRFTDVSLAAGFTATGDYRMCGMGDFDADGLPDVGVGNYTGPSRLYLNGGDGTFTDVAGVLAGNLDKVDQGFGLMLADFDLDGLQDVFVPRWQQVPNAPSGLFRNAGGAALVNESFTSGIGAHTDMGHNVFDLDNDGWLEIFIGTGAPTTPMLDVLLRIHPGGPGGALLATDISQPSGIWAVGPTRGHGSAAADYDQDGDIDLVCNNGGMGLIPGSQEHSTLFRNQGNGNDWIEIDLAGILSNRPGVGAQLSAVLADGRTLRLLKVAGTGFGNTDSPIQHFGLGHGGAVERLDIRWPSGIVQTLLAPDINERHHVVETGMRLLGPPVIGTDATLQLCGPSDFVVDVLMSTISGQVPMPGLGGILQVLPPYAGPWALALDDGGQLDLVFPVPLDPQIVGSTVYLQGGAHAPGNPGGALLTNLLPMTFE